MNPRVRRVAERIARVKPVALVARLVADSTVSGRNTYAALREQFIRNGRSHAIDEVQRRGLVDRFELIHAKVPIVSSLTDGLFLAELLLNTTGRGSIVETGCYAGGSSAKLSILAQLLGRELIVCDSFAGLPSRSGGTLVEGHCRRVARWWSRGQFAARLETVKANIEQYGEIRSCRFVEGWFEDTLTDEHLPDQVGFVFSDVDLPSSARTCLAALWPRLTDGAVYVTHDVGFIGVLLVLHSQRLWERFNEFPPILFGAGYGLCDMSPSLGYMIKGRAGVDAAYLKALTMVK